MALTKITPQMFDTSAAGHDFNIDNGTFVVDASANHVGIGTASPATPLHITGITTFDGDGASRAEITSSTANSVVSLDVGGFNGTPSVARDIRFLTNAAANAKTERMRISSAGHFIPAADSTYNIGANATRFANAYFDNVYGAVGSFSSTLASSDATFTASSATAAAVNIKRSSSSGRAQLTLQDESGNNIWRIGATGGGATDFAFFDGSENVLTLSTNNSATFAGNIFNTGTIQATHSATISAQTNMQLALRDADSVNMRANFMVEDNTNTNRGGLAIQATEAGVTNDRDLYLQPAGGRVGVLTLTPQYGLDVNTTTRLGNITGFRTAPDSNYAIKLLQSSSLTHGGYFQINGGTATGLEINANSGSYSGTALFVQQSSVSTGGFLARFANSSGNKVTIETDGTTNFAGNVKASDIIAAGSGGLALQTDEGTKRLFVKDNGDVKVGQLAVASATSAPLHVAKASTDVQAIFGDNNSSIDDPSIRIIGRNSANSDIRYTFAGLDADANKGFLGYNQGSGGFVNALEFNTSGNVTIAKGVSSDTQSRMYVWTALDNSGNSGDRYVKICRVVAGQSARVNIELVGRYGSYGNGSFAAYGMLVGQCNNDSNFDFVFYDYRNGQTGGQIVAEIGQVNVSSVTVDIYIKITSYAEIVARGMVSEGTLTPETGNAGSSVGSSSAPSGYINIPLQQVLIEDTNGLASITSRLGVGTASPRSDIRFTTGTAVSTKRWGFGGGTGGTNDVFYIINESNVGQYMGHGNQTWTAHSDERIKENIVDVGTVLPSLMNIRCVKYNLISNPDTTKIGFIAQDWESSFPEVVDENKHLVLEEDGTIGTDDNSESTTPVKAMAYTETIPLLLKAIQEQQALIESLQTKVAALEGE